MLEREKIIDFIKSALKEDIGRIDLTTAILVPPKALIKADIIAKSAGVLAGLPLVEMAYQLLDNNVKIKFNSKDGDRIEAGKAVCYLDGPAASILKGERVALNLLSRASGIATLTARFVEKAKPYKVAIMDTRKTTPNMRHIERYAVKTGGGENHRFSLSDQVLIKDNHLAVLNKLRYSKDSSFIADAVRLARKKAQKNVSIEIEVKNIAEFEEALSAGPDIIMLDNMLPEAVREAVKIRNASGAKGRRVMLEASGNITLENVEEYAKSGIDRISIGALTHSAPALDFALDVI